MKISEFTTTVRNYPDYLIRLLNLRAAGKWLILGLIVGVVAGVILITQGQRRIPVQYAKKIVGRKVYGGRSQYIPLRVNTAGVIPIIFAQSIMVFPTTIASFFNIEFMDTFRLYMSPGTWLYMSLYSLIIIFFTYFYTAIVLNPVDLADNMKKYGGFIPGIRPGKRTSDYIDRILSRVTLPGAVFLAFIAILPDILYRRPSLLLPLGSDSRGLGTKSETTSRYGRSRHATVWRRTRAYGSTTTSGAKVLVESRMDRNYAPTVPTTTTRRTDHR